MPRRSRKNLNIALNGARGRMGREIRRLIGRDPRLKLTVAIGSAGDWPRGRAAKAIDVVIDFSSPEGAREALRWCRQFGKPLVMGTTGLKAGDLKLLKSSARKIPILYAANMSLGVAVVRAMLRQFARIQDWRFQIEETHHRNKKDKPSGTAKMLAQRLEEVLRVSRVPIRSRRKGQAAGIHQIDARGLDESILLRHTAHDRRVFARGAIGAARWLFDKGRPGLYDLSDLYQVD